MKEKSAHQNWKVDSPCKTDISTLHLTTKHISLHNTLTIKHLGYDTTSINNKQTTSHKEINTNYRQKKTYNKLLLTTVTKTVFPLGGASLGDQAMLWSEETCLEAQIVQI